MLPELGVTRRVHQLHRRVPVARGGKPERTPLMRSKFILTVTAGLLAGTMAAGAQPSGAPSNEKDRTGQPTDSGVTSAQPNRPAGTQSPSGTVGGGAMNRGGPAMRDDTPLQPGGISPSAPPQGREGGSDAQPRPR
jgi:hypothetical protein